MFPKEQHMTSNDISRDVVLIFTGLIIMDPLSITFGKFAKFQSIGLNVSQIFIIHVEDPEHIVVVHCNSGKGRTGTAICAILLYIGFSDNMDDCLRFYGHQRFICGKGVS